MQRKCTSGVSAKKSDTAGGPCCPTTYVPPLCNPKSKIQFSFFKSPLIPLKYSSNNTQPAKVRLFYHFRHLIFIIALFCGSSPSTFHFEVTCHSIDVGFRKSPPPAKILPSPDSVPCFSQTKSSFSSQHGNPEDPRTLRLRQPRQSHCRS